MSTQHETPETPCRATRKDGRACTLRAVRDGLCFAHGAATRESQGKGGRHSAAQVRMQKHLSPELVAAQTLLLQLLSEVKKGTIPPRVGEVLGGLCGRLLDIAKFRTDIGESRELEQRLQALEAALRTDLPTRRTATGMRR